MIAFLTGRVAHKGAAYALLEVRGVGYKFSTQGISDKVTIR